MKKTVYLLLAFVGMSLASCSDQNDVVDQYYDDIENTPLAYSVEYTLTDADYTAISNAAKKDVDSLNWPETAVSDSASLAKAVTANKPYALNDFATANKYVPAILRNAFPGLSKGSSIKVTYNNALSSDSIAYMGAMLSAPAYALKPVDYQSIWGAESTTAYLSPSKAPETVLPGILSTAYPDAAKGDLVKVSYKYSDTDPDTGGGGDETPVATSFFEDFQSDFAVGDSPIMQHGWTDIITQGTDKDWNIASYQGSTYVQMSAYESADPVTEAWLITPAIDLSKSTGNVLSFDVCIGHWNADCLSVMISTDSKAVSDPANAAWDDVTANFTIPSEPAEGYGEFASAGTMQLDEAYAGKTIYVALKYHGENGATTATTTYEIDNIFVGSRVLFSEDFQSDFAVGDSPIMEHGWTDILTAGADKDWNIASYKESTYVQMSAYESADPVTEAWLITPAIDLSKSTGNTFSFDVCIGHWDADCLSVMISTDPQAVSDPANAAWDDVTANFTIPSEPAEGYGEFASAGAMNLDTDYAGKTVYIALKYHGENGATTATTTYEIDNILVESGVEAAAPSAVSPASAPVETRNVFYTFDGSTWMPYDRAVVVNPADLTAMGSPELTDDNADNYIPVFLGITYPYAQEGDKIAVMINSKTVIEYTFTTGAWVRSPKVEVRTEQFVYADQGWMFDPTINITMIKEDYQLMVDYVLSHEVGGVDGKVYDDAKYPGEAEYYYGFSWYYLNVSFAPSYRTMEEDTEFHALDGDTDAQAGLLWKRLLEEALPIYLGLKYPDSPAAVQGVPMVYNITLQVYYPDCKTGDDPEYTLQYKVLTGAPNPTFQYVSGGGEFNGVTYYTPEDAAE